MPRRRLAVLAVLLGLALALPLAAPAAGQAPAAASSSADRRVLQRYAADTWRSFELLLDPATGLPSDNASAAGERSRYTSPTNVGAYLWSTLAARDAGIISPSQAGGGSRPPWPPSPAWSATSPAACSTTGTTRPAGPS